MWVLVASLHEVWESEKNRKREDKRCCRGRQQLWTNDDSTSTLLTMKFFTFRINFSTFNYEWRNLSGLLISCYAFTQSAFHQKKSPFLFTQFPPARKRFKLNFPFTAVIDLTFIVEKLSCRHRNIFFLIWRTARKMPTGKLIFTQFQTVRGSSHFTTFTKKYELMPTRRYLFTHHNAAWRYLSKS